MLNPAGPTDGQLDRHSDLYELGVDVHAFRAALLHGQMDALFGEVHHARRPDLLDGPYHAWPTDQQERNAWRPRSQVETGRQNNTAVEASCRRIVVRTGTAWQRRTDSRKTET